MLDERPRTISSSGERARPRQGDGKARPGRHPARKILAAAAVAALPLFGSAAAAQPKARALANPPANIPRTQAMDLACQSGPGQGCQDAVVAAIDQARSAEGVGPLVLPSGYGSLSVPEQLFVLADEERTARGLPGFAGLSSNLDQMAAAGASVNADPVGPSDTTWGSNWAGGEASALLADYDWMYDDGAGSPNLDCGADGTGGGCWDHRQNILGNYGPDPSIGTAATTVDGVTSLTEIFSSGAPGQLAYAMPGTATSAEPTSEATGYLQSSSDGAVFTESGTRAPGSLPRLHSSAPVVGVLAMPGGAGYWEVAADGGVFSFGHAKFYGSAVDLHLGRRVVGMAAGRRAAGYWLATTNGGVYSYGDARFYGTPKGHAGNAVVGIAATPDGRGYWLATSHGAIYAFGDAHFYGPHRRLGLSSPVVAMAPTRGGHGYWLVTKDGHVYAFGEADNWGSAGAHVRSEVVGMAVPPKGHGYLLALRDGTVLGFGHTTFAAREKASHLPAKVVAIAAP